MSLDNNELFNDNKNETLSMDEVFKSITCIYDDKLLRVVYNTLNLLEEEKDDVNKQNYIMGLSHILYPINGKIRSWIQDNLSV